MTGIRRRRKGGRGRGRTRNAKKNGGREREREAKRLRKREREMAAERDLYAVLGVDRGARDVEVRIIREETRKEESRRRGKGN